jgi:hypothetical protein
MKKILETSPASTSALIASGSRASIDAALSQRSKA